MLRHYFLVSSWCGICISFYVMQIASRSLSLIEFFFKHLLPPCHYFDTIKVDYRVRHLIYSGVKFTHNQLNTEAEITKLHMAILLTIMDNIMPKIFIPASFQPQQRPKSNCGQKVELSAIAHEPFGISNSFHAGWQPMVRPSTRPTNQCWISFSKKVFI